MQKILLKWASMSVLYLPSFVTDCIILLQQMFPWSGEMRCVSQISDNGDNQMIANELTLKRTGKCTKPQQNITKSEPCIYSFECIVRYYRWINCVLRCVKPLTISCGNYNSGLLKSHCSNHISRAYVVAFSGLLLCSCGNPPTTDPLP